MKLKFKGMGGKSVDKKSEPAKLKPASSLKKDEPIKLKGGDFLNILRRIHLGGLIEGCVLDIAGTKVSSMAVDPTNSIFLTAGETIGGIGFEAAIGIGNLDLLIKFLAAAKDEEISLEIRDERRLIVSRGNKGQLDYLLTETDLIPTRFDPGEDGLRQLTDSGVYKVPLTEEIRQEYLQYYSILGSKEMTLIHDKSGEVQLSGGRSSEHQFHLPVGRVVGTKAGDDSVFTMQFYGDYLASIMKVLEIESDRVAMYFDKDKPLIIMQSHSNIWALLPVMEAEGGA